MHIFILGGGYPLKFQEVVPSIWLKKLLVNHPRIDCAALGANNLQSSIENCVLFCGAE